MPSVRDLLTFRKKEPATEVPVEERTKFVLGFMYDFRDRYVLLMSHRPTGTPVAMLSGIGGIIPRDDADDPGKWMTQAAQEATGLHVADWMPAALITTPKTLTYVYMTQTSSTDLRQARPTVKMLDEPKMIAIDNLSHYRTIPMLNWLVPMLADPLMVYPLAIEYCDAEQVLVPGPKVVS